MGVGEYLDRELKLLKTIELAFEKYNKEVLADSLDDENYTERPLFDSAVADLKKFDNSIQLDAVLKNQLERAFNTDLSRVRIHTGPYAEAIAGKRNALAVTIGNDIYFARGKYSPETEEGIALIAHEISHVVQYASRDRFTYYEDVQRAEEGASLAEEIMKMSRLHNIDRPLLGEFELPRAAYTEPLAERQESLNRPVSGTKDSFDNFLKRRDKPLYEIILKDGTRVNFEKEEIEKLFLQFEKKVVKWIKKNRQESSDEDFSSLMMNFMTLKSK